MFACAYNYTYKCTLLQFNNIYISLTIEKRRQFKLNFHTQGSNIPLNNSTNSSISNSTGTATCLPM